MGKENSDTRAKFLVNRLTDREPQTIRLLCEGKSKKDTAPQMFISINTVKTHTKNIFTKLNVRNNIELVLKVNDSLLLNEKIIRKYD